MLDKRNTLLPANAREVGVVLAYPASDTEIVSTDARDGAGVTLASDTHFDVDTVPLDARSVFTLNDLGVTEIDPNELSRYAYRDTFADLSDDSPEDPTNNGKCYMNCASADTVGETQDPILSVNYVTGRGGVGGGIGI